MINKDSRMHNDKCYGELLFVAVAVQVIWSLSCSKEFKHLCPFYFSKQSTGGYLIMNLII